MILEKFFPDFSLIFCKIFKFPDISLTGKTFPIFPGFPDKVGTLSNISCNILAGWSFLGVGIMFSPLDNKEISSLESI